MADTQQGFGCEITFQTSSFTANITDVTPPAQSRNAIRTTHNTSTSGIETYIASALIENGEMTFTCHFDPEDTPPTTTALETIDLEYPLKTGDSVKAKWSFSGFCTNYSPIAPMEDLMTATITVKVAGAITITAGSV